MEPFNRPWLRDDPDGSGPPLHRRIKAETDQWGEIVVDPESTSPFGITFLGVDPPEQWPDPGSDEDIALSELGVRYMVAEDGTVDFYRVRTLQTLQKSGEIDKFRCQLASENGILGYWHQYKLVRRGQKALIAIDVHPPYADITDQVLSDYPDIIADAFPMFIACLANSKTRVPGSAMMGKIPDGSGQTRWTLLVDVDIHPSTTHWYPVDPTAEWNKSTESIASILAQSQIGEAVTQIDRVAYSMVADAHRYFNMPGAKQWVSLKASARRSWAHAKKDPVGMTLLIIRPLLGIIDDSDSPIALTVSDSIPFDEVKNTLDLVALARIASSLGAQIGGRS